VVLGWLPCSYADNRHADLLAHNAGSQQVVERLQLLPGTWLPSSPWRRYGSCSDASVSDQPGCPDAAGRPPADRGSIAAQPTGDNSGRDVN